VISWQHPAEQNLGNCGEAQRQASKEDERAEGAHLTGGQAAASDVLLFALLRPEAAR